jgi:hypothetical protein
MKYYFLSSLYLLNKTNQVFSNMQLRSGNSTLRRDSRNYDEFRARTRYQQELERMANEDSIYEDEPVDCDESSKTIIQFNRKARHLIYLNEFQRKHKHNLIQRVETVKELYELFRYNIDFIIEYYNNPYIKNKSFAENFAKKGKQVLQEFHLKKRTRKEEKLYKEFEELIQFVVYSIEQFILKK